MGASATSGFEATAVGFLISEVGLTRADNLPRDWLPTGAAEVRPEEEAEGLEETGVVVDD